MKQDLIDGRYVLGGLLGSGGMARVFLAHDELLNRDVALKVLRDQYAESEEFVERFRREARSAALNHPDIVSVYDWGRSEDGTYYMAMECIPGGTLKERIVSEGPLNPDTTAELGSQVTKALGFAHERGVIHRDIKPQNILLSASGDAKVADFGIARAVGAMAATAVSQTGLVLGAASYISPEQVMGEPVGPASDLYSLGVVLYEMLTGEAPFGAETLVGLCMKHANEPPRPPKELNQEVPEGMNALVLRLLAKKAEDRYGSAAELAEDLRRVRNGLPPLTVGPAADPGATRINAQTTVPLTTTARKGKTRTKAPWIAVATFVLFALLGSSGWHLLQVSQGQASMASKPEDSQAQASAASSPENETTKAQEETKQATSTEVASVKGPTQTEAPSNTAPKGTSVEQASPVEPAAKPSAPASTPANDTTNSEPQIAPQPAPTQQQAQVQVSSSQPSYSIESENRNTSGTQREWTSG